MMGIWSNIVRVFLLIDIGVICGAQKVTIETKSGTVAGQLKEGENGIDVEEYLGIPFAEPPVGNLRFRHPQPKRSWNGELNATQQPNSCLQMLDETFGDFSGSAMWNSPTPRSEDCLYLNVWVPKSRSGNRQRRLDVMAWIFGGGFYSGTITLDLYHGLTLAAENNIIVVMMQYRLSFLGFGTLLSRDMPGNQGLFDQLLALEWVQDNIEFFGGNPGSVTLFGESAGAASVNMHLLSPLSKGKFHRAIMQSSTATAPWATISTNNSKARTLEIAKTHKCLSRSSKRIANCLRKVSHTAFNDGNDWISDGHAQFPFVPVMDGKFLTEDPLKSPVSDIPILLGFNKDEGTFFLLYEMLAIGLSPSEAKEQKKFMPSVIKNNAFTGISDDMLQYYLKRVFRYYEDYPIALPESVETAIKQEYTNWIDTANETQNLYLLQTAAGDHNFVCDVIRLATEYARRNFPAYLYYFTQRSSDNPWPTWTGVLHGDEIPYVFGKVTRSSTSSAAEKILSRAMMKMWSDFAKTGNPTPRGNYWPKFTADSKKFMTLNAVYNYDNPSSIRRSDAVRDLGNAGDVFSQLKARKCAFWNYADNVSDAADEQRVVEKELATCKKNLLKLKRKVLKQRFKNCRNKSQTDAMNRMHFFETLMAYRRSA